MTLSQSSFHENNNIHADSHQKIGIYGKTLLQGFSPLQLNIRRKIHKTTDFSTMLPERTTKK